VIYSAQRVELEVFAFYSSYDNKIASVLTGGQITPPVGPYVVQSANEALMRLAGVEASVEVSVSTGLSLVAEAFYTWGEQQVQGGAVQPADRIPPFQGRLGLAYQPRPWIWIEPYVRFAAEQDRLSQRDIQDPRINPQGTPGWVTLGVRSQWTWNDHVDLVLEVRNITNANYREHGSGYQAAGAGVATSLEVTF
jgi:outer membrane receptor protein involved in Fe transport